MTWAGIKKGDLVWVVEMFGERSQRIRKDCEVVSCGKKYITVVTPGAGWEIKFDSETGHGEYGQSVHTEASYKHKKKVLDAHRVLREVVHRGWRVPDEALFQAAEILKKAMEDWR